jgi:hypothetical protein
VWVLEPTKDPRLRPDAGLPLWANLQVSPLRMT